MANLKYNKDYDFNKLNKSEIEKAYKTLAKTVNDRLLKIERAGVHNQSNAYRYMQTKAFDAKQNKKQTKNTYMAKSTKTRVIERPTKGMTYNQMKNAVYDFNEFLHAKTSSAKGTKTKYDKAYASFNDNITKNGGNPVSREVYDKSFWSDGYNKLSEIFGSDVAVKILKKNINSIDEVNNMAKRGEFDNPFSSVTGVQERINNEIAEIGQSAIDAENTDFEDLL